MLQLCANRSTLATSAATHACTPLSLSESGPCLIGSGYLYYDGPRRLQFHTRPAKTRPLNLPGVPGIVRLWYRVHPRAEDDSSLRSFSTVLVISRIHPQKSQAGGPAFSVKTNASAATPRSPEFWSEALAWFPAWRCLDTRLVQVGLSVDGYENARPGQTTGACLITLPEYARPGRALARIACSHRAIDSVALRRTLSRCVLPSRPKACAFVSSPCGTHHCQISLVCPGPIPGCFMHRLRLLAKQPSRLSHR